MQDDLFPTFFRFPDFPDLESGNPDFCVVHVNQLEKSFNLIGHMTFFRISGFSGFSDPESGNPEKHPYWGDPGVTPDPMVPHLWRVAMLGGKIRGSLSQM